MHAAEAELRQQAVCKQVDCNMCVCACARLVTRQNGERRSILVGRRITDDRILLPDWLLLFLANVCVCVSASACMVNRELMTPTHTHTQL